MICSPSTTIVVNSAGAATTVAADAASDGAVRPFIDVRPPRGLQRGRMRLMGKLKFLLRARREARLTVCVCVCLLGFTLTSAIRTISPMHAAQRSGHTGRSFNQAKRVQCARRGFCVWETASKRARLKGRFKKRTILATVEQRKQEACQRHRATLNGKCKNRHTAASPVARRVV